MTLDEINGLIDQKFAALPKQLRTAARFVRENPEQVALNSLRATSDQAQVHPSNLMRLVRELGFERYNEFRDPFKAWLSTRGNSMSERVQKLRLRGKAGRAAGAFGDAMNGEIENLRATMGQVKADDLVRAVEILRAGNRIYIIGLRSLYSAAFLLDYSCRLFMNKTVLLDGRGGTLADETRFIRPGDAVVVMTQRRYTRETLRLAQFAKKAGASLISIVDSPLAPTVPLSDVALVVNAGTTSVISSAVSTIAIVQALVSLLISTMGDATTEAFERSERQLREFDSFVEE